MKLRELTEEQLTYLHVLSARGFSVRSTLTALSRRWPDAHAYSQDAVRDYLASEEAKDRIDAVLREIREKASEYAYSDKGSRLDLLNERALSLANQLRELEEIDPRDISAKPPDPNEVAKLNAELRQTLAAMQKEMDPLSAAEMVILSPAQALIQEIQKKGLTPSQMRAAMEDEPN